MSLAGSRAASGAGADGAWAAGPEVYYRPGRVVLGAEYYAQHVSSPEADDPWFHGGELIVAWLVTGETRAYNPDWNYFRAASPARTVIESLRAGISRPTESRIAATSCVLGRSPRFTR